MSRPHPVPLALALCLIPSASPAAGLPGRTGTDPNRTDLHGDLLPDGALARLGTVRWRHGAPVRTVAFSPDGGVVAALDADGAVRLWTRANGRERKRWRQQSGSRGPLAFSPDGRLLATGDGGIIHLWDAATGAEVRRLEGHQGTVHCLAFAPDGRTLASGAVEGLRYVGSTDVLVARRSPGDKVLRLWDVATGRPTREFSGHEDGIETVAWSPDGRTLATGGWDRTIRIWDAPDTSPERKRRDADTSPERKRRDTTNERQCFTGADASVGQVLFLRDGKTLVSAGDDHTLRFWDVAEGKQVGCTGGGERPVDAIALSPDGKTIASVGGGGLRLWDAAGGEERTPAPAGPASGACVAFSPDGRLLVAPSGHAVGLWNVATGRPLAAAGGHRAGVTVVGFTAGGQGAYTAGSDKRLRTWTVGGQERSAIEVPGSPHQFAVSADGGTAAVGASVNDVYVGDKLRLVDLATGKERWQMALEGPGWTLGLAFAPDGRALARLSAWHVMNEGYYELYFAVEVWDAVTGSIRGPAGKQPGRPVALGFSPDGKRVFVKTAEPESSLRQWDAVTGRELRPFTPGRVPGGRFTFSPDGSLLAVYGRSPGPEGEAGCPDARPDPAGGLQVWETATGRQSAQVSPQGKGVEAAAFSPDGRLLAFADGATVRVWDAAAWTERAVLRGHDGPVNALAFSPDGRRLLTGSDDTTALVWDLGRLPPPRPRRAVPALAQRDSLWQDLAAADAARAWRAMGVLTSAPEQAVSFLRDRLRPPPPVGAAEMARLLEDLDSIQFVRRERASEELELLGERAEELLRGAAKGSPSAEVRRRAQMLLAALRGPGVSSEELRTRRALLVLRHIGSEEALRVARGLERKTNR
jgi:WD40 repeat protein